MDDFKRFVDTASQILLKLENVPENFKTREDFAMLVLSLDILQKAAPNCWPLQEARSVVMEYAINNFLKQVVEPTEAGNLGWILRQQMNAMTPKEVIVHTEEIRNLLKRNLLGLHFGLAYKLVEAMIQRLIKATEDAEDPEFCYNWKRFLHRLKDSLVEGQL